MGRAEHFIDGRASRATDSGSGLQRRGSPPWRPHSRIAHLAAEAALLRVDHCHRRSCRLN